MVESIPITWMITEKDRCSASAAFAQDTESVRLIPSLTRPQSRASRPAASCTAAT